VLSHEAWAAGGLDEGHQREGQLQRKHHLSNKQVPAAAAAAAASQGKASTQRREHQTAVHDTGKPDDG
jgi:hypothetical protein